MPDGPANAVTEQELRQVVSKYWTIDDIAPARLHTVLPEGFSAMPFEDVRDEPTERKSVPGLAAFGAPAVIETIRYRLAATAADCRCSSGPVSEPVLTSS
jgi:hypothetical protein